MATYENLGPTSDEDSSSDEPHRNTGTKIKSKKWRLPALYKLISSRDFLKAVVLGQCLSVLLCGTGVFSGLLQNQNVNLPTAQSFLLYFILSLVFTTRLAYRGGDRNLCSLLRTSFGWKYFIIAVIDVEANYMVVMAYHYTSVTSVQLLDCFAIGAVLLLSRLFLHTRYQFTHYLGVLVSLVGLGGLVGADVLTGKNSGGGGSNVVLGDFLVIAGATLYGISNVTQEFVVKKFDKTEFLGMLGLYGTFVSGIQVILVESDDIARIDFSSYKIILPWLGFVMFQVLIYTCMSYVIEQTSATVTNISILSADFYSLIIGIFIFNYSFHILYFIAFVVVIIGVSIYSFRPTSVKPATVINDEAALK